MRVTQTAKDPQTMFTAARNSIRYEIWNLSRLLLRAVVRLVTPTEIKALVDMSEFELVGNGGASM